MTPASGREVLLESEEAQITQIGIGKQANVSPVPSIATVGAAFWDVLLSPEADAAVATSTTGHLNSGPVVEHDRTP